MSSVFFISDLHLGHKNICKFRKQFDSVEDHDNFVKDKLLSTVNKRSKLYLLGDIAFTSEAGDWVVSELLEYCPNTTIVLGNHCTSEGRDNIIKYVQAGIKVHALTTYKDAWLTHCPIHPDELRKKTMVIHGHVHGNIINDKRYFDVSCENVDYTPIRYDQILERMKLWMVI